MKKITEFVIRVIDLLEAEGRVVKRAAVEYALAVLMWLGALLLFVAATAVLAVALYVALAQVAHRSVALVLVAAFLLLVGGACAYLGKSVLRKRSEP